MIVQDIKKLSTEVQAGRDTRLLLSLSTGADSLAMYLRCLESEAWDMANGVYYCMEYVPGLPFITDYIEYLQDKLGIKITKMPHPMLSWYIDGGHLQSPERKWAIDVLQNSDPKFIGLFKNADVEGLVKAHFGIDSFVGVGVKQGDSAMRRIAMRKMEGINKTTKKWYPIWDFEKSDVIKIIKRHGIKVSPEYDLFGISFDGFDYRFLKPIKDRCPKSLAIIKDLYPLVELKLLRNERYHPEWAAIKGNKAKVFAGDIYKEGSTW